MKLSFCVLAQFEPKRISIPRSAKML
jgi:hypothetical protein